MLSKPAVLGRQPTAAGLDGVQVTHATHVLAPTWGI
jgi:hypothetical protein